ncbi:hypothetical protein GCM10009844_19990 [Nocardioides koreensis]|uniref:Uncharacterized protein n=1 Tax=Nocardioides koreensis TaxID=433651 RepID=A0ABP5LGD0_9ACTN
MWVMDTVTYVVRPVGSTPPTRLQATPATTATARASTEARVAVRRLRARVVVAALSSDARRRLGFRTGQAQGSRAFLRGSPCPFTS